MRGPFAFLVDEVHEFRHLWTIEVWTEPHWYICHRDGKTYHRARWWSPRDWAARFRQMCWESDMW